MSPNVTHARAVPLEMRPFGCTEMQVSVLGLGAAEIGFENTPDHTVDRMVGQAHDTGLNVIDTAAMYGDSEEKIGRVLRGRRDRFLLFTKCGRQLQPRASLSGFLARADRTLRHMVGLKDGLDSTDWHPRALKQNIETSLIRLKTDRIDLIQLHSCSEETLREGDVLEVLQRARQSGKVRYIGYSGDGQAALYAVRSGFFDALQISINIAEQEALELIVPLAREKNMGIIAKRPIATGLWKKAQTEAIDQHICLERLQKLQYDFLKGPQDFETALRFTISVPGVSTAIVGTTDIAHFGENIEFARAGSLDQCQFDSIHNRWKQIAQPECVGQVSLCPKHVEAIAQPSVRRS